MGNPSKDVPWMTIFETYDIYSHNFDEEPFYITAKEIKEACQDFKKTAEKEVRILCYQAQRKDKPQVFVDRGLFLLPVKNGQYAIIKGRDISIFQILTRILFCFNQRSIFDYSQMKSATPKCNIWTMHMQQG